MTDYQKYFLQVHVAVLIFALILLAHGNPLTLTIITYILIIYFLTYIIGFNLVHRTIAHRQFAPTKFGKYLFSFFSLFVMVGDPITLSRVHRYHHMFADTDLDPHTPIKGIMYSFIGWLFDKDKKNIPFSVVRDLLKDSYLVFLLREQKKIIWVTIIFLTVIDLELGLALCICMWINWIKECFSVSIFDHSAFQGKAITMPFWSWLGLGDYHDEHHKNPNRIHKNGPTKLIKIISKNLFLIR